MEFVFHIVYATYRYDMSILTKQENLFHSVMCESVFWRAAGDDALRSGDVLDAAEPGYSLLQPLYG